MGQQHQGGRVKPSGTATGGGGEAGRDLANILETCSDCASSASDTFASAFSVVHLHSLAWNADVWAATAAAVTAAPAARSAAGYASVILNCCISGKSAHGNAGRR